MRRQWLGVLGIAIAVIGIARGSRMVVWVAIGVLGVAFVWRLLASRSERERARGVSPGADGRPKE